jgi:hypothetical protein
MEAIDFSEGQPFFKKIDYRLAMKLFKTNFTDRSKTFGIE